MQVLWKELNRIPVRTWNWLEVNDTSLDVQMDTLADTSSLQEAISQGCDSLITTEEVQDFINRYATHRHHVIIDAGQMYSEPEVFSFITTADKPAIVDDIVIEARRGSVATVVIRYESDGAAEGFHAGRIRLLAEKDAKLDVVVYQNLSNTAKNVMTIGGTADEDATINVTIAELGAQKTVSGCNLILAGENSTVRMRALYVGDGARELDMNYRTELRGANSDAEILARGVLMDTSKKVFRDTLDFVRGASGAKGREEEYAVLLSPYARNVSVPLMLCTEDDVEGEHASSAGRLDENILFYLQCRGITELDAKKIMVEGAFSAITEELPDTIRTEIMNDVKEKMQHAQIYSR